MDLEAWLVRGKAATSTIGRRIATFRHLFAWAVRRGLPQEAIRNIALTTAARTLTWGGLAFLLFGLFGVAFPGVAGLAIATPFPLHNLDTLGLPFLLLVFAVLGVGVTSFVSATQAWRRRLLAGDAAPLTIKP